MLTLGGTFYFRMMGCVQLRSTFPSILVTRLAVMRLRLDVPLLRGDLCGRLLEAYGKRTRTTYCDIVGFHVLYGRIHPFLDGNGRTGRMIMFRECLRGGSSPSSCSTPRKPSITEPSARSRTTGESASCASPSIWRNSTWRSSPPPSQDLLLRLLEKYIKHSSFDERDLSFFKWCGISPRELSLLVIAG